MNIKQDVSPAQAISQLIGDMSYSLYTKWIADMNPSELTTEVLTSIAAKSAKAATVYIDAVREEMTNASHNLGKYGNLQGKVSVEKAF